MPTFQFIVRAKRRVGCNRQVADNRCARAEDPAARLSFLSDESKITTLIDQLTAALKDAGIERSTYGETYSIYSAALLRRECTAEWRWRVRGRPQHRQLQWRSFRSTRTSRRRRQRLQRGCATETRPRKVIPSWSPAYIRFSPGSPSMFSP
jgi:hypothetical protein